MSTNKINLRTVEEFMGGYTPIYQPIYPLFLSKSQAYAPEVGRLDFRRVAAVGDIRAKHVTPKDTEVRQISVMDGKKSFRKYFLANQFTLSEYQDREGVEDVVSQVLDEHQIQYDEMLLLGDVAADATPINNGLYNSSDPNYTLNSSQEVQKDGDNSYLFDMHAKVMVNATAANQVAGRKIIMFYGSLILPLFNSLYATGANSFKKALQDVLGAGYSLVQMPVASTPAGANGWLIANLDQCKLHYTANPQLLAQGNNEEKMYLWFNFMMGSSMLEVLAKNAIIRQPATLEA